MHRIRYHCDNKTISGFLIGLKSSVYIQKMTTIKNPRDYSKGIVYKLCCLDTSVLEVYVGSTLCFSRRKAEHKRVCDNPSRKNYNLRVYQFIRENGGWHNWEMVQIEAYSATSKRDLESRERDCMERFAVTLNGKSPARIEETRDEYHKNYRQENKAAISEYHKNYRQENKVAICEYYKNYSQENKVAISEYKKVYRQENKVAAAEYDKARYQENKKMLAEKVTCDCGSIVRRDYVSQHRKTKKHLALISK
jgi:hypothetical protein